MSGVPRIDCRACGSLTASSLAWRWPLRLAIPVLVCRFGGRYPAFGRVLAEVESVLGTTAGQCRLPGARADPLPLRFCYDPWQRSLPASWQLLEACAFLVGRQVSI